MNSVKEDTFEQLQAKNQDPFGQLGDSAAPNYNNVDQTMGAVALGMVG